MDTAEKKTGPIESLFLEYKDAIRKWASSQSPDDWLEVGKIEEQIVTLCEKKEARVRHIEINHCLYRINYDYRSVNYLPTWRVKDLDLLADKGSE